MSDGLRFDHNERELEFRLSKRAKPIHIESGLDESREFEVYDGSEDDWYTHIRRRMRQLLLADSSTVSYPWPTVTMEHRHIVEPPVLNDKGASELKNSADSLAMLRRDLLESAHRQQAGFRAAVAKAYWVKQEDLTSIIAFLDGMDLTGVFRTIFNDRDLGFTREQVSFLDFWVSNRGPYGRFGTAADYRELHNARKATEDLISLRTAQALLGDEGLNLLRCLRLRIRKNWPIICERYRAEIDSLPGRRLPNLETEVEIMKRECLQPTMVSWERWRKLNSL